MSFVCNYNDTALLGTSSNNQDVISINYLYLTIFDQNNYIKIAQSYCDIEIYLITIAIIYQGDSILQ